MPIAVTTLKSTVETLCVRPVGWHTLVRMSPAKHDAKEVDGIQFLNFTVLQKQVKAQEGDLLKQKPSSLFILLDEVESQMPP